MPYVTRASTATPDTRAREEWYWWHRFRRYWARRAPFIDRYPHLRYLVRDGDQRYSELGLRLHRRYGNPLATVLLQRVYQLGVTEEELRHLNHPPHAPRGVHPKPPCIVRGCEEEMVGRSLCKRHYGQWDWWHGVSGVGARKAKDRRPKGTTAPPEVVERAHELYLKHFQNGDVIAAALAEEFGYSITKAGVYRILHATGARVRRQTWRGPHELPQWLAATMIWLYEECGWTVGQIAAWRGVVPSTISYELKHNGFKRRPRSPYAHLKDEWARRHFVEGEKLKDIAAEYGILPATVSRMIKGRPTTEAEREQDRRRHARRYDAERAARRGAIGD